MTTHLALGRFAGIHLMLVADSRRLEEPRGREAEREGGDGAAARGHACSTADALRLEAGVKNLQQRFDLIICYILM